MRPVDRGDRPNLDAREHGAFFGALVRRLGSYRSYCEVWCKPTEHFPGTRRTPTMP